MSTPTRGARRKAQTGAAILDAAEQLFRRQGFAATTLDEIAATADVSVGSVYVHFQTKAGLYLALVEQALDLNEAAMAQVAAAGLDSPLERVLAAGDAYLNFHVEHPGAFQMIALRVLEPAVTVGVSDVEERIARRVERLVAAVRDDLQAAVEVGEVRADLDADRAMRFLWGSWNGVIALSLRQDGLRVDVEELRRTLTLGRQLISDGLRAGVAGP
jgi:TetR/AcrR family transcriptional regulator